MSDTINNAARAEFAAHGLDAYATNKDGRADYDEPEIVAQDMICDLLHLLRAHGVEPMKHLTAALGCFSEEEAEEQAGNGIG